MDVGTGGSTHDGWLVLFNVPNTISWIRIVLLFLSLRYFGYGTVSCRYRTVEFGFFSRRNYVLFVVLHTISGLLDSVDGSLARWLQQTSYVGQYFESILDQYAHIILYASLGFLYPSYIIYFFLEIGLEIWHSMYTLFLPSLATFGSEWLEETTLLSQICHVPLWEHPQMRLFRWYGSDVFHTLLVLRYILIHDNDRRCIWHLKRYMSMHKLLLVLRYVIIVSGISSLFRTLITSCYLLDRLFRMAHLK